MKIHTHHTDRGVVVHADGDVSREKLLRHSMVQWNKRRFVRVAQEAYGFVPNVEKKEDLLRMGEKLWEVSYKGAQSDAEAAEKLDAWTHQQDPEFLDFSELDQNKNLMFSLARWADQAFPTVVLGEKFCAALLATHVPDDMLDEIEAPWHAFVIEIPGKLLSVFDGERMQRTRLVRVVVQRFTLSDGTREWGWIGLGEYGQHIWRAGTSEQVIKPIHFRRKEQAQYEEDGTVAFEDDVHRDERLFMLISRLVFNVCLAMSEPEMVRAVGSSHKRPVRSRQGPPEQRVYQVGRPITLDCRNTVREYVEGTRSARELTVQVLVRGHWKRQAHGPMLSLRRRQWILPYWRGPEDKPIAIRPHVLADEGEGPSDG